MIETVSLRPLAEADLDSYRRLRLEALKDAPNAFGSSYETEVGLRASQYRDRLARSAENYILGAWTPDGLVGMVGFVRETAPNRRHVGSIWGLYVARANRGRGHGRRLLNEAIDRSRRQDGLDHLRLTVVSDNVAVKRLYESLGFRAWGSEPASLKVDGVDFDEIHMWLDLATRL